MMRVVHHVRMERINEATVAAEVRANLARRGKSKVWLAQLLGMSPATLHRRLNGTSSFSLAELTAIADGLGIPVGVLLAPEPVAS